MNKLFLATTLATTATVMGQDAELFFTFWALLTKKDYEPKEVNIDYKSYEDELRKVMSSGSIPK